MRSVAWSMSFHHRVAAAGGVLTRTALRQVQHDRHFRTGFDLLKVET